MEIQNLNTPGSGSPGGIDGGAKGKADPKDKAEFDRHKNDSKEAAQDKTSEEEFENSTLAEQQKKMAFIFHQSGSQMVMQLADDAQQSPTPSEDD